MEVGLAALGGLGQEFVADAFDDRSGHPQGVDQLVLGVARMNVVAHHRHVGRVGAECLVFDLPEIGAVQGVGPEQAWPRCLEWFWVPAFSCIYRRAFLGPVKNDMVADALDLQKREILLVCVFAFLILFLGLYPSWVLDLTRVGSEAWMARLTP